MLTLSPRHAFARRLVNSGRLSTPTTHRGSTLSTMDRDPFAGAMVPGAPAADAPVGVDGRSAWLLDHVGGHFELLVFAPVSTQWLDELQRSVGGEVRITLIVRRAEGDAGEARVIEDAEGLMHQRYDSQPGTVYLLRPDQHVAARWRVPRLVEVLEGLVRAQGRGGH